MATTIGLRVLFRLRGRIEVGERRILPNGIKPLPA
jgi:hypothetical protein